MRRPEIPGFSQLVEIGEGASATVYRADQPAHGRQVAIKVLNTTMVVEAERLAFERELTAMGRLADHPHIVDLLQSGFSADGRPYIVMPWYRRGNYAARVDRDGPLGWAEVLDFGVKVASALHTAHARQIVHRDVKPANVFMGTFASHPILADFGISSFVRPSLDGQPTVTISTTPLFAAPEVLNGDRPTVASDLYSFGATLFSLLTGRAAYGGASMEVLVAAITSDRPPPRPDSGGPPALDELVVAMLAKDPDDRPPSLLDAAHRLAALQRSLGLDPTPVVVDDDADAGGVDAGPNAPAPPARPSPSGVSTRHDWATHTTAPPADPDPGTATTAPPHAPPSPAQHTTAPPAAQPAAPEPTTPPSPLTVALHTTAPPAGATPAGSAAATPAPTVSAPGGEATASRLPEEGRVDAEADERPRLGEDGGARESVVGLRTVEVRPEHRVPDPRREKPPEPEPPAPPPRRRWPQGAAALLLVAALVLGAGYWSSRRGGTTEPPATASGAAWTSAPELVASATAHQGPVGAVAFSPDGAWLATGGQDGVLRLAPADDPSTGTSTAAESGWVLGLAWSPDGTALATATSTGMVAVHPLTGLSTDGTGLSSAGTGPDTDDAGPSIEASDVVIGAHPGSTAEAVAWSPTGDTLASAGGDGQVRLWYPDGTPIRNLAGAAIGEAQLTVAWSPDGTLVAAGGKDGVLRVWDAASGQLLASLAHPDWVRSVDWSPDGTRLATAGPDGVARLWTLEGRTVTSQLDLGADLTGPIRWSPDGLRLGVGTVAGQVVVWDPATGDELSRTADAGGDPARAVVAVAWAPGNDRLAAGRQDGTIDIWAGQTA